jgi:hypothetical protein
LRALLALTLAWVAPSTARIDYAHPEKYTALPASLGNPQSVKKLAATLPQGPRDEDKLRGALRWFRAYFKHDPHAPEGWKDFDQRRGPGLFAGCADNAVIVGTLTLALGLPTVWVKTLDVDWIREYKADPSQPWGGRGDVFLEVFADKRWRLVDASEAVIYDDYDPSATILPGNRLAYDKGADPQALTMSFQVADWRAQTKAFLDQIDVARLPVGRGRPLIRNLHVVADTPVWQWVRDRAEAQGVRYVSGFNIEFAERLPATAGHWLVLTAIGKRFPLPTEYRDRYSPLSSLQLEQALKTQPSGQATRELADGTRVVLIYARDDASMRAEIEKLRLQ